MLTYAILMTSRNVRTVEANATPAELARLESLIHGVTALCIASQAGATHVAEVLIKGGADPAAPQTDVRHSVNGRGSCCCVLLCIALPLFLFFSFFLFPSFSFFSFPFLSIIFRYFPFAHSNMPVVLLPCFYLTMVLAGGWFYLLSRCRG